MANQNRTIYLTRKVKAEKVLGAGSLGDLKGPGNEVAERICKKHRWRVSKFNLECSVCGLVVDRFK